MRVQAVHVDGQQFVLRPDEDVKGLRKRILKAGRAGGGFVKFRTVGRATIRVLITPHIGVRFETFERDESEIAEWEAHPPDIDVTTVSDFDDVL